MRTAQGVVFERRVQSVRDAVVAGHALPRLREAPSRVIRHESADVLGVVDLRDLRDVPVAVVRGERHAVTGGRVRGPSTLVRPGGV